MTLNANKLATYAFYLLTAFIVVLFFNACSPDKEVVAVISGGQGPQGEPGASHFCTVEQLENGALITCDDESQAFVSNGQSVIGPQGPPGVPGLTIVGPQGPPGAPGEGSSSATLHDYAATNCTQMIGTSNYVKKNGANYKFYSSSSCSSSSAFAEVSQGEAYWVSATTLATHAGTVARTITFGGN